MSHLDLGNGLTETRPYTDRYFPSAISVDPTTPLAGSPVLQWTYGTDNVGNILSIADALTPASDKGYTYQDHQYFLTGGTGPWGDLAWTYDQIGNRLTETRDGTTDTYAYAPNADSGNTALLSTVTLGLGGTRGYTYGPAGHLEQVTAPGNAVSFLSDDAGRLTRLERPAGDAQSDFLYDGRSFLRWAEASSYSNLFTDGFETGDGSCWTLAEGSDINAGTATCPRGDQIDAVYSSDGLLHTVTRHPLTGPESARFYLYLAGRPVAQLDIDAAGVATPTWLTTDHLGTPVLATDAAGTVLWQGGFEPFGADYSGASLAGVDLRFPGQWVDGVWEDAGEGTEAAYNVYRWLEPESGRYVTPDPLGALGGILPAKPLFSYANLNPISFLDPLGLDAITDDDNVQDCAYCLFKLGGFGNFPGFERQMLIFCEDSGKRCLILPASGPSGGGSQASTSATISLPAAEWRHLCALIHTHPKNSTTRADDAGDQRMARGLSQRHGVNVPIYVIHPTGGITNWDPATPDLPSQRIAKPSWVKGPKKRCKKPCDGIDVP